MLNTTSLTYLASTYSIPSSLRYFNTIFLTLVMLLTIIGNSLALHAFFTSSQLKKITYYFIASLCISDLLVATCSIPLWTADTHLEWMLSAHWKSFYRCIDIFCSTWSIMSLAMISIERYICIKYALRYYSIMTRRRSYFMIVFILVYSMVALIVNYISMDESEENNDNKGWRPHVIEQFIIVFLSYIFPVFIKLFTYTTICIEARKQSKRINEQYKHSQSISERTSDANQSSSPMLPLNVASADSRSLSPSIRKRPFLRKSTKTSETANQANQDSSGESDFDGQCACAIFPLKKRTLDGTAHKCVNGAAETKSNGFNSPSVLLRRQNANGNIKWNTVKSNSTRCNMEENKAHLLAENKNTNLLHAETCESVDKRKRSVSCPPNYNHTQSRQSLEPNDAYAILNKKEVKGTTASLIKRVKNHKKWSPASSPILQRLSTLNSNRNRREQKARRFRRELRATKVVGLIMGTFLVCWTPFMLIIVITIFQPSLIDVIYIVLAKDLHYLNSAINPVLYVALNRVYRNAVWRVLERLKRKFKNPYK